MASAVGRIGAIIMPYICIAFKNEFLYYPYLIFSVLCFMAGILCTALPFDTTNRELDKLENVL
jgi:hypothetical protein